MFNMFVDALWPAISLLTECSSIVGEERIRSQALRGNKCICVRGWWRYTDERVRSLFSLLVALRDDTTRRTTWPARVAGQGLELRIGCR